MPALARRRLWPIRRRRRARSDLVPLSICEAVVAVQPNTGFQDCNLPLEDSNVSIAMVNLPTLSGAMSISSSGELQRQERLSRGLKLRGMQFDLNIATGMLFSQLSSGFVLLVARFAIVVMELDPITGGPLLTA